MNERFLGASNSRESHVAEANSATMSENSTEYNVATARLVVFIQFLLSWSIFSIILHFLSCEWSANFDYGDLVFTDLHFWFFEAIFRGLQNK